MSQKITKNTAPSKALILAERIASRIFLIQGFKVMLDYDLAALYGVQTKVLNQAVSRNMDRFPEDFMFRLDKKEVEILRSQIVTSNRRGGRRYLPRVFTEQGVVMLSSVLNSQRAIQVNIQIMRTFTRLREMLITDKDFKEKIEKMEAKYDKQFKAVFEAIKQLIMQGKKPKAEIGFKPRK